MKDHQDRHVYVEGRRINVCLWCERGPENGIHIQQDLADLEAELERKENPHR